MHDVRLTVHAGVCGFVTDIAAASDDGQHVRLTVTSPCENLQGLAAALPPELDAYQEIGDGYDGALWTAARGALRGCCSGCMAPTALFKAMQVAAQIALPGDITLTFHPEDAS